MKNTKRDGKNMMQEVLLENKEDRTSRWRIKLRKNKTDRHGEEGRRTQNERSKECKQETILENRRKREKVSGGE